MRRVYEVWDDREQINSYVISENEVWLPGSYASEADAEAAFDLDDKALLELQYKVNYPPPDGEGRLITKADLDKARAT